ncbi:hypothetical protein DPMN_059647 [Dreissena polymorpha]|uniref:Uncharacterized protein n=1 Tax=Dreissena polymorpha TaxID=45954 RepID=A0A9D4HGT7_DREPO|nr:hypothetical protein DPMN_059647 [Dreissena polymorpha]
MPLNEAERLSHDTHTKSEVKVLEEDVQMHMSMAESMQARQIGEYYVFYVYGRSHAGMADRLLINMSRCLSESM